MVPKLNPKLLKISELVQQSVTLSHNDHQEARIQKIAADAAVMNLVKTANAELVNHFIRQALTGLGVGAGLAVPLVLGGSHLMNQANEMAKERSEELWDKITRAALGAAGIGAGIYALNKITNGAPNMTDDPDKYASADKEILQELMHKVATVVVVDEMLNVLPESISEDTKKLAEEIRRLNNGYLVELLNEVA